MTTAIEQAIVETITYFNLYRLPLTAWEIKKNIFKYQAPFSLQELERALNNLIAKQALSFFEGFYFLNGSKNLVETRKKRYLIAQQKVKAVKFFISFLSCAPFVKAIFICNNLAYQNAPLESDVDLAIITTTNRIWIARFCTTFISKLLRKRPTPKNKKDKICLSFYFTEDNLNLQKLAYQKDIHFSYWLKQFLPVFGKQEIIKNFFNQNQWTKNQLPNFFYGQSNGRWRVHVSCVVKPMLEKIFKKRLGNLVEKLLKKFQLRIMPDQLKALAKEDNSNVIISDQILKFHDKDTRQEIQKEWESSLDKIKST